MQLETAVHADVKTQPTKTPYAITKLEESSRVIRQSANELPALRKRLEKNKASKPKAREIYGDLKTQLHRLTGALDAAALSLMEAEQGDLASHTISLGKSVRSFNPMTPDYTTLCNVLGGYLAKLPVEDAGTADGWDDEAKTTNHRIIGHLMNNVRMGYYPTCTDNIAHIVRGLELPESVDLNLLDPCCGCGIALRSLADGIASVGAVCKTYGIELDSYRAEEALERLDRVGFGSFYHSRISSEAFHAMLLNPPYLSVMTEGGNNTRSERRFLMDSLGHLMPGGMLIYIIPHYRLTEDIARLLCDNFSDISIWKFTGGEFKKYRQVAVLGVRQKRQDGSEAVPEFISSVLEPDTLPELTELPEGRYCLPDVKKEVALFKGAVFNERELAEQLCKSKSFSRIYRRNELDSAAKRPLLPLSIGQIGLVGGSGLINGLLECDTPHIIKGRIVKEKRIRTEDNIDRKGRLISTTIMEVISNKLVFNLLTPEGFKSLTEYGGSSTAVDIEDDSPSTGPDAGLGYPGPNDANATLADGKGASPGLPLVLGKTVITANASNVLSSHDIQSAMRRHQTGDWGDVTKGDWNSNDAALKHGDRILSSYTSAEGTAFWIITECDRSATTVLLPEDY